MQGRSPPCRAPGEPSEGAPGAAHGGHIPAAPGGAGPAELARWAAAACSEPAPGGGHKQRLP